MTSKELRFLIPIEKHTSIPDNFIYVYSFAINPESFQPSGSCNFSRFDNDNLKSNLKIILKIHKLKFLLFKL